MGMETPSTRKEVQIGEQTLSFDASLFGTAKSGVISVEGHIPAAEMEETERNTLINTAVEAAKSYGINPEDLVTLRVNEEGDLEFQVSKMRS